MLIFAHCDAAGRFQTCGFWQGQIGCGILVRAALMACAFGALVLTSTKAEAQTAVERYELFNKEYVQLNGEGRTVVDNDKCFDKDTIELLIRRINSLIVELIKLKYDPGLPARITKPIAVGPEIGRGIIGSTIIDIYPDDVITKEVDTLVSIVEKLPAKICPPEPVKAAAPPPPVTPVPVTPPVAETPKPVATVCSICRSIADQIQDIDQKIAGWVRQVQLLHEASDLKDPGIQKALKDIASDIAALKATRAQLEAKKTECEKKCVPPRAKAKHATPDSRREKGPPATKGPPVTKRSPGAPTHDPRDSAMRQGGG